MPWSVCSHQWNTASCSERLRSDEINSTNEIHSSFNQTTNIERTSSADEYYHIYMLGINSSKGFHDLGSIKLDLFFCLIMIFILMYVCIFRGVKSTGKFIQLDGNQKRHFSFDLSTSSCLRQSCLRDSNTTLHCPHCSFNTRVSPSRFWKRNRLLS